MSKNRTDLHETMDAAIWSQEFTKKFPHVVDSNGNILTKQHTEELMVGWFANSIMTGYDTCRCWLGENNVKENE